MANWAGILEQGRAATDFRLKTAAVLRIGTGFGHAHNDTLDLQLVALGARMANDVGWRGGYSMPQPTSSMMHNLVEVNGQDWIGHSWVDAFVPGEDVSYMRAQATPPDQRATHRSREIALITVSEGSPGHQEPAPLPYTNQTRFAPDAILPERYLFDLQRTVGGNLHTWCFHGTVSDQFDVNIVNPTSPASDDEKNYLRRFLQGEKLKYVGDAASTTIATWRLRRTGEVIDALTRDGQPVKYKQSQGESDMLEGSYDPKAPRKFVRAYLLDSGRDRALVGYLHPVIAQEQTTWPFLFVQRRGQALESVHASIIEPYAGEPFIRSASLLDIPGNETDSQRAVAVEVTTSNGRKDLCFSDGRPDRMRQLPTTPALRSAAYSAEAAAAKAGTQAREAENRELRISGRFAYISTDNHGLRLAHLVEGTNLTTPWGTLTMEKSAQSGKILKVDYWNKKVWLDGDWSDAKLVGQQIEFGNDKHKTSFTVTDAARAGEQTVVSLDKAIDLSYAHVLKASPDKHILLANIGPVGLGNGMNDGLSCTTDDLRKSWHCKVLGEVHDGFGYLLDGDFSADDFPEGSVFRLWEFGVGDTARLATSAVVRRSALGTFIVESNTKANWRAGNLKIKKMI
jgi:hypothetical protein